MTTIAYHHKDKQIAIDSRIVSSEGRIISDAYSKTIKTPDRLYFMSGATGDYQNFVMFHGGGKIPEHTLDCDALMLRDRKVFQVIYLSKEKHFYEELLKYNHSIGSGLAFALAAMDFGKSAKDAVAYAATKDSSTGGKIVSYSV